MCVLHPFKTLNPVQDPCPMTTVPARLTEITAGLTETAGLTATWTASAVTAVTRTVTQPTVFQVSTVKTVSTTATAAAGLMATATFCRTDQAMPAVTAVILCPAAISTAATI